MPANHSITNVLSTNSVTATATKAGLTRTWSAIIEVKCRCENSKWESPYTEGHVEPSISEPKSGKTLQII